MAIFRRPTNGMSFKLPIRFVSYRDTIGKNMSLCHSPIFPPPGNSSGVVEATSASLLAATVSVTLPVPPSVNHQYATVNGRRLLSAVGRAYKAQVGRLIWLTLTQMPNRTAMLSRLQSESLSLSIRFYFTSALRRDVDGGLKIAQDALCEGLGINDNRIVEAHLYKHVDKSNPRIEVSLAATCS